MLQIIYLGVQPTPYTQYFLQHLKKADDLTIRVFFCKKIVSDLPWKSKMLDPRDKVFNKILGVDWNIVKLAFTDKTSLFYVVGYNDPTKFLVMLIRGFLNYPYCYFTDSIKTEKTPYHTLKLLTLPILFRKVRAIFTTGEFGIKLLRESRLCSENTRLINLPFFVPFPNLNNKIEVGTPLIFLCSGRLVERKGFDLVIRAFEICKKDFDAQFVLQIAGTGVLQEELRQQAQDAGLEKEVLFLGWLEPDEMTDVMKKSNVFIHFVPVHDPFPVAVLEAMAAALPVIGSNRAGSVVERVENGKNGFIVEFDDLDGLVKSIMNVINQPEMVEKMSIESRKTAEKWPVEWAETIIKSALN